MVQVPYSGERHDDTQMWSISDPDHGARSVEENIKIARSKKSKYNISRVPLFPTIPLTSVIVDNLHTFLRVADTLIDLFLLELRRMDHIDKATKLKNLDRLQYLRRYEEAVKSIGVSGFSFWLGRESKVLKCRTLAGPERSFCFRLLT